jgi:NCS1 family nucleobase:cation symporter-1
MGMYGSMFFIFIRGAVCLIWYGINTYYGANLMSTMLRCIFGHIWANWENTLPLSADVTSKQLLCFFLVWFIELPFVSALSILRSETPN